MNASLGPCMTLTSITFTILSLLQQRNGDHVDWYGFRNDASYEVDPVEF